MDREEPTSTTDDLEEGGVEDKSVGGPIPSPKTYISQLRIWNGTYSQANILKIFLRPFPFLLSPVVCHIFLLKFYKNLSRKVDLVCVLCIWNADRVFK